MFSDSPIINWRNAKTRYCLEGVECVACKKNYYPKKYLCECGGKNFEPIVFRGRGTLLSFTSITVSPLEFKRMAPYCIGLIKLEQGPKLIAQLADVELQDLKIGIPMVAVFRKHYTSGDKGIIHYGLKFVPGEDE